MHAFACPVLSFCALRGPQVLSVMLSYCLAINATSVGCTGSLAHTGWLFRVPISIPEIGSELGMSLRLDPFAYTLNLIAGPWKTCLLGLTESLVPILLLSLHPNPLQFNFTVAQVKMWNVFLAP